MTREQRIRLVDICVRSKRGGHISEDDRKYSIEMFNKYQDEYPSTEEINDIVYPSINPCFKPSGKVWNYETKKYE